MFEITNIFYNLFISAIITYGPNFILIAFPL